MKDEDVAKLRWVVLRIGRVLGFILPPSSFIL